LKHHYFSQGNAPGRGRYAQYLTLIFLLVFQTAFCQVTVPAGNTYTSVDERPLGCSYAHDRVASIYNAAELNIPAGATITGIRYYMQASDGTPKNTPIKLCMSNAGSGSGGYTSMIYSNVYSASAVVYSGTLPASSFLVGQWIYIPFQETTSRLWSKPTPEPITQNFRTPNNSDGPRDRTTAP
jgi:hypothetical protein